MMLGMTNDAGK